jgi:putative NADPH-quinone reductase
LGHPGPQSFNHALAQTCRTRLSANGHTVHFHDLYEERFNPVFPTQPDNSDKELLQKHCADLRESDGIIIIHPNWWGQPPAIVKGWLDRVLQPGLAYAPSDGSHGAHSPRGLLKATTAIVLNTSNTPDELEDSLYKDPLEILWKNRIFGFCGVHGFQRRNFRVVKNSDEPQRAAWLWEAEQLMDQFFPKE